MTVPHLRIGDFVALFLMLAFGGAILYLNYLGYGFTL